METIFVLLMLLSAVLFVVGLIKPSAFRRINKDVNRKQTSTAFILLFILFSILVGVTADPVVKEDSKQKTEQVQTDEVQEEQVQAEQVQIAQSERASQQKTNESPAVENKDLVVVTRVIDGDTIEIAGGKKVRYIGIDTPETVHPSKPIQCFGTEASNKNRELVAGKKVRLEKDVSETDRYGRLLRYVYVGDTFVNDYLVRQGYANASSYPPDVKYQSQFTQAQKEARDNNRGLWASCSSKTTTTAPGNTSTDSKCDSSYPTVCIASAPPDLDCKDVPYTKFRVLQPDPHGFDGNKDGVGCQ